MVEEVLAYAGKVGDDGNVEGGELLLGTETGEHHQAWGVDCACAEDGFGLVTEGALGAVFKGDVDAGDLATVADVYFAHPSVCEDGEVGAAFLLLEDRVDVGDRGTAAVACVWVVRDVEEANALLEGALVSNLLVEVFNHRNVQSLGAAVHPVDTELVPVPLVHGLYSVLEVVQATCEGLEVPARAALCLPSLRIVFKGTERNEGVVARAATEDFGARVADVGVAHWLLGCAVVIVEVTADEV